MPENAVPAAYTKERIAMANRVAGLHDRLNRISHWDVNVTNLERSRSWYEATTTLRVVARTKASQSFPSFGIGSGSFTGYLLKDGNLPRGVPMIHLVEWQNPAPVGKPYRSQANVGWYRICPIVDDIEAARGAVIAQGSEPFAPTTRAKVSFNRAAARSTIGSSPCMIPTVWPSSS
jgi:catechol 2,3-dioxygenase-like lactoylglutathione lyase family enzyme